jgi:dihydroorotate dehydrogenase electron transfer subunit
MFFAATEAAKDGCTLDVIIGARGKDHLLYVKEFGKLPKTTVHIATDDGSEGHKGYNVDLLPGLLKNGGVDLVFSCGPERMLLKVSDITFEHKIPSQLSLERYMKCGYGLCGNCVVDPLGIRLCTEGPVVKNETARKIAEFGKYHRDELGKKHSFA